MIDWFTFAKIHILFVNKRCFYKKFTTQKGVFHMVTSKKSPVRKTQKTLNIVFMTVFMLVMLCFLIENEYLCSRKLQSGR